MKTDAMFDLVSDRSESGIGYVWNGVLGCATDDTVVFVHGMCGMAMQFANWLIACASWNIPAYSIDLGGHKQIKNLSLAVYEDNILVFLCKLPCQRITLVGHSMGAPLCMNVSWQCPKVKTMISLMSAPLSGMLPPLAVLRRTLRWQYLRSMLRNEPLSFRQDDAMFFLRGAQMNGQAVFVPESGRVVRELIRGIKVRRKIPCQHQLFYGTRDYVAPARQQKRIAARLGLSEQDCFQIDCGHMPMLEEKADRHLEFILSASSFLSRLP
ncbi:alpha/beta fold hydrolase [Patescibacteria group bacterium]|nr:alpha/beta fold hydrolase [Patescibacteria group bacterium]